MNKPRALAPWKEYLNDNEAEEIQDMEDALDYLKKTIAKISRHRERVQNRASMRRAIALKKENI